jgi:hypothetical protein
VAIIIMERECTWGLGEKRELAGEIRVKGKATEG